jgi:hypothetical protein
MKIIKITKQLAWIILHVILFSIMLFSMLGEKVAYNDGAGWDGLLYREATYNFSNMILNHQYDAYRIQRILPFAVINIIYNIFHIEKSNLSLLWGMQILNFIILAVGCYYFYQISKKLKFSISAIIVGFSVLFFNYPTLKLIGYYPFLTDLYALVFALMQFYYFVTNKTIKLVIVSILGAFIWPILLLCGLILAFLPNEEIELSLPEKKSDKVFLNLLKIIVTLSIPVLFLLLYVYVVIIRRRDMQTLYCISLNWYFIIAALITTPIYVWFLLKPINITFSSAIRNFFRSIKIAKIIPFFIIYLSVKIVQHYLSDGTSSVSMFFMVIIRIIIPSAQAPFAFLICNFMYYGFIVILMCFYWKLTIKQYAKYGYSYFIIIILGLIMSLNTESRHMLSFVPFLIFPFIELINNKFSVKFSIVFSVSSLILSRFWFKINVDGIEEAFVSPPPIHSLYSIYESFPAQRYFMAIGPWMAYSIYLLFLGIFIFSVISIFYYLKKMKKFPS